jgi:hypothetical protein
MSEQVTWASSYYARIFIASCWLLAVIPLVLYAMVSTEGWAVSRASLASSRWWVSVAWWAPWETSVLSICSLAEVVTALACVPLFFAPLAWRHTHQRRARTAIGVLWIGAVLQLWLMSRVMWVQW